METMYSSGIVLISILFSEEQLDKKGLKISAHWGKPGDTAVSLNHALMALVSQLERVSLLASFVVWLQGHPFYN